MIINKDIYECPKCKKRCYFDTSKLFETNCPVCNTKMKFEFNADCDTEREIKTTPTPLLKVPPKVECPYCHSTNTRKISGISKATSVAFFGIFSQKVRKQWHCNNCDSDF